MEREQVWSETHINKWFVRIGPAGWIIEHKFLILGIRISLTIRFRKQLDCQYKLFLPKRAHGTAAAAFSRRSNFRAPERRSVRGDMNQSEAYLILLYLDDDVFYPTATLINILSTNIFVVEQRDLADWAEQSALFRL